jgi:hypothetical protein
MARHVFIDNSNVYGVAQRVAESRDVWEHWTSIRIHYKSLFELIEGQDVVTKCLAGSVPPDNDVLWQTARGLGYTTDLLHRVEADDGRLIEQGVDEILHLKIANAILDYKPPQTLVIVSGDGRVSQCGTSFPAQAERALKWKWDVEVWSWSDGLTKQYNRLCGSTRAELRSIPSTPTIAQLPSQKRALTNFPAGGR